VKNVKDLQDEMRSHSDVGLAMQVQNAIQAAISAGRITDDDELTFNVLDKIRSKIYEINRNPDPTDVVFQTLAGKTSNPTEAALQYVENLMR
jgi:hypothetical protein